MEACTTLGLLFQERKKGHLVRHSAGCCLPASWFIFFPSFTMTLQALLLNSSSYFSIFFMKMAKGQVNRQCTLCVCGKKCWEEQVELRGAEEYKKHKLLWGSNGRELISNCVSISGTPLWKSSVNYIVCSTAVLIWTGYDFYDKKRAGSHLTKPALPLHGTHTHWRKWQLPEPLKRFLSSTS